MSEKLLLGKDDEGKQVYIECFHSLVAGQTNLSGKTTTVQALAGEAVQQDYTVLFFDTKPTLREFEGYHDIPVCYQPTTDPLILLGLVEAKAQRRFSMYLATLMRISERAKKIEDVITNAEDMETRTRSGFIKDACHTLADLLRRVNDELKSLTFSNKLELKDRTINVMTINKLSNEAQQLVLKTAFEQVLYHHNKKTIVVVDEAFRFFPQEYGSACKKAGQDLITQGAKTKCFVWPSTQFLAPTDKNIMRACANKILGRQDHNLEIEATQRLIPGGRRTVGSDEIMTLKRGEFLFVPLEGKPSKVKVIPPWERGYKSSGYEFPKQEALSDSMLDSFNEKADELSLRLEKLGF